MDENDDDSLRRSLDAWAVPALTEDLRPEVWRRIAGSDSVRAKNRWRPWFAHPAFLSMVGVCGVLAALLFSEMHTVRVERARNQALAQNYLRVIDPLAGPATASRLEDRIAWMKPELGLSDAQLARIRQIHEEILPQLEQYAAELKKLQAIGAEIDREWKSDAAVDFLAVADLKQQDQDLDERRRRSVDRLIASASAVMTEPQRRRYLHLVAPALARNVAAPKS